MSRDIEKQREINIETIYKDKSKHKTGSLTDWAKPPTVADLKADYDAAEPAHSAHVAKVQGYLGKLNGELNNRIPKGRSRIQPKLIRKQAEWRYSALSEPFLATSKLFNVDPRTFEDGESAGDNELLLNYQFNTQINKNAFIDEYVRTLVDEGTAVVQVGWKYEETEKLVEVPVVATPKQAQMLVIEKIKAGEMSQEQGQQLLQSGQQIPIGTKKVSKVVPKHNHPTVHIREFDELVIDPTCQGDIDKAQFIISPFETSISELKKDKSYSNLDKLLGSGEGIIDSDTADAKFLEIFNDEEGNRDFEFKDVARRKFTAYEYMGYWDIDGKGITTAIRAVYVADTMIKLEKLPFPDNKLPFVLVQYLPKRKSLYGEPDGALLADSQDILGAVTRGMIDVMGRSANGQQGIEKGMLDVVNQKRFDRGENYYYNPGSSPQSGIHMQTYPEIPNSAMAMLNLQINEANELSGVKPFGATNGGSNLTATAARGALDSASKRELGMLRRLSVGIEQIGRKIIAMNAVFLSDEEVIRVTNKEFRTIKRDDLAGEYDLKLSISTPEADDKKASELAFMLQTTGQTGDPEEIRMIRAEIAKLRGMPELAHKIETFQPKPSEEAIKREQAEVALIQSETEVNMAKAQGYLTDIPIKEGKAKVETAKARNLESKSDKQDLDFVKENDGSRQQEEVDKMEHKRLSELDSKAFDMMGAQDNGLPGLESIGEFQQ
ncbi:MAG: chromosome partitioning protein ParB [Desulfurococcales archaeon ex4484_217_2]|nr:MAG: chromosome partitioning protein ParB [Desulfurococcales archaeon ex4484_217_2]